MTKSFYFYAILGTIIVILALAGLFTVMQGSDAQGSDDERLALASCLAESGATFYGAFWCSHCQSQKRAFGNAVDALPYVECATPDGRGQTEACAAAEIESYPTWVFGNGERVSGALALADLATLSDCPAPSGVEGE